MTVSGEINCRTLSLVVVRVLYSYRKLVRPTAITCENAVSRGPRVLTQFNGYMSLRPCHRRVNRLIPVMLNYPGFQAIGIKVEETTCCHGADNHWRNAVVTSVGMRPHAHDAQCHHNDRYSAKQFLG